MSACPGKSYDQSLSGRPVNILILMAHKTRPLEILGYELCDHGRHQLCSLNGTNKAHQREREIQIDTVCLGEKIQHT